MTLRALLIILILSVTIFACQPAPSASPTPQTVISTISVTQLPVVAPTQKPYAFKTSKPGGATLHGVLLVSDPLLSRPEADDAIFLVPLAGDGVVSIPPFVVGEVPQAEVDEITGEFVFTDIAPGNYAVVALTVGEAQIPARFHKDNNFAIVRVKETDLGQTIELDYLVI